MDGFEVLIFIGSFFTVWKFFSQWYAPIFHAWPRERGQIKRTVLSALPMVSLFIILFTLTSVASFDVVNEPLWVIFYTVLGVAWLWLGVFIMNAVFDLSKNDDVLNMDNQAALLAYSGGFLGLTLIYAGANVGDGPGWWCVVFAGGIGLAAWVALALLVNVLTGIFERVTVERDTACGVRLGSYLLASGIILGRASAGDWTSASMTVVEFASGWPVLVIALFAIVGERIFTGVDNGHEKPGAYLPSSIILAVLLLFLAALSVALTPLATGGAVLWKPE